MRSRQFTSFNPVLIPWNQITLPSLPPLLPIPCPFLLVAFEQAVRLGKRVKKTSWFFQITLSPSRKPVHRLPFCRLLCRLDKFSLSVLISKQEDPLLSVSKQLGSECFFLRGGNSLIVLFDISISISWTIGGEDVGRGWVLPLHSTALCYFEVLFGSQYRALASPGAVPQINVTPNYWKIPLVVIKCRYRPIFNVQRKEETKKSATSSPGLFP